jgi:hypothetical protein
VKPHIKLKLRANVLQLHPQKPWPQLIEHIDLLRRHAESGELLGIFEICKWRGDVVWTRSGMRGFSTTSIEPTRMKAILGSGI